MMGCKDDEMILKMSWQFDQSIYGPDVLMVRWFEYYSDHIIVTKEKVQGELCWWYIEFIIHYEKL